MINILLLLLAVSSSDFALLSFPVPQEAAQLNEHASSEIPPVNTELNDIQAMLRSEADTLNTPVIDKVITTLKCAASNNVERNNILTIIDYSLPSNQKRLWVFDLAQRKLLFHTYVSHGIRSGTLLTNYFSNKNDSKASSIGVYKTQKAYYGREGLSLRLDGLDKSFNDNAANRAVVMHGGWYVDEHFIKRYGRPGRSWGCPALPPGLYQPIINTIKDQSLMVIYYPSDDWFGKSKFLTCSAINDSNAMSMHVGNPNQPPKDVDMRAPVLFVDNNRNDRREEEEPLLVMSADKYEHVFRTQAPLGRMLRRQINNMEYIALSSDEFNQLVAQNDKESLSSIDFIIPVIVMSHGYYETQMKFVKMGKINEVRLNSKASNKDKDVIKGYTLSTEIKPAIYLKETNRFIRWLGL